jgi:hypothetical protein
MKAIWTKYIGPTNFRGSRVKASAEGVSITVGYDDALNSEDAHAVAALALCWKAGWPGDLYRGGRPDGNGFVFVFAEPGERVFNPTPSYAAQAEARKALAGPR